MAPSEFKVESGRGLDRCRDSKNSGSAEAAYKLSKTMASKEKDGGAAPVTHTAGPSYWVWRVIAIGLRAGG